MRVAKRICAFALALTVAFLSVGYEPPKAKAVVAETATAASILATYLAATGMPLMVIEGGAAAASAGTASLISGYAAATGGTVEVITTSIAAGATIGTGGVIILSVAAVAALAAITAWVIDEYGLIGEDGEPATESVELWADNGYIKYGDDIMVLCSPSSMGTVAPPNTKETTLGPFYFLTEYNSGVGYSVNMYSLSGNRLMMGSRIWQPDANCAYYGIAKPWYDNGQYCYGFCGYDSDFNFKTYIRCNPDADTDFAAKVASWFAGYTDVQAELFAGENVLAAAIDSGYVPKPELAPDTQVVLNPNLAPEFYPDAEPAPEVLSDAIFEKLANGDFTPQYTEQPVADPDPDPDTGVDSSGVLGWLEAIWNAIKSLVEAIGDKLMQLFVPSEEYMEALPEALTDAFAERTGFLTYPMSLLFGFVDLIATPAGDFILEWDDVYEPFSRGKLISAGQFNVTQYVNSNQALSNVYSLWKTVVSGYLIFMFFDLCYKKYNAIVRDRLG